MTYIKLGSLLIRFNSKGIANWGYPRVEIGGLSFWSWTNAGDFSLAAYHPRSSLTWLWFVHISSRPGRGYLPTFSRAERERLWALYLDGNPHVSRPRWFHAFWQPARMRRGQWNDFVRLPFGFAAIIGHQERMPRKPEQSA